MSEQTDSDRRHLDQRLDGLVAAVQQLTGEVKDMGKAIQALDLDRAARTPPETVRRIEVQVEVMAVTQTRHNGELAAIRKDIARLMNAQTQDAVHAEAVKRLEAEAKAVRADVKKLSDAGIEAKVKIGFGQWLAIGLGGIVLSAISVVVATAIK